MGLVPVVRFYRCWVKFARFGMGWDGSRLVWSGLESFIGVGLSLVGIGLGVIGFDLVG